jgi:hypothetical protein
VIEPGRNEKFEDIFFKFGWWCQLAKRHFGKEPHPAIRWLVTQYDDKEDRKPFRRVFGSGTAESIARRLYQKARSIGEFERVLDLSDEAASSVDDWVEKAKGDLYQFTFKQARCWPEPGLFTTVYYLAHRRQDLAVITTSEWEEERFREVFGTVDDEASGLYLIACKAMRYDLEYWSYLRTRVEKRRQISKSQSD